MKNIKWEENQSLLKNKISKLGLEQILIHSDSIKSLSFIDFETNTDLNTKKHIKFLLSLSDEILFPSFNYDFPKLRKFDYDNFECQVGIIPENFRLNYECSRTFDPMFSVAGLKLDPNFCKYKNKINSFEDQGFFNSFTKSGSGILIYGADISSLTIVHYVESIMQIPYRYKKEFKGNVLFNGIKKDLIFKSHFRPYGLYLDYDWNKIVNDLTNERILLTISKYCHLLDSKKLLEFWSEMLKDNIFYLLDSKSLEWILPKLNSLGRPFLARDFEN